MKVWTYEEAKKQLDMEMGTSDEVFIEPDELLGYFNKAIDEAESEISKLHEDYFLTYAPIKVTANRSSYALPPGIFAQKIRGFWYHNGADFYEIMEIKGSRKFETIHRIREHGNGQSYRYFTENPSAKGGVLLQILPAPRETNGVTLTSISIADPGVFTTAAAHGLTAGMRLNLFTTGTLPEGFSTSVPYFVASVPSDTTFTLAHTPDGSAIEAEEVGSGTHSFVAEPFLFELEFLRNANRLDGTDEDLIDIPEFINFIIAHVKVAVADKEAGQPRLMTALADLEKQRKIMTDTLTGRAPDNHDEVEQDLTHYQEHN
jgi:hypothetical protein